MMTLTTPSNNQAGRGSRILFSAAAAVIILAGLKAAAPLVVPILAAIFLAVVSLPALAFLCRTGMPRWLAAGFLMIVIVFLILWATTIATKNVAVLAQQIPQYRSVLDAKLLEFNTDLAARGIHLDLDTLIAKTNPSDVLGYASEFVKALANLAQSGLFVILTLAFLLSEASVLPSKIRLITGRPEDDLGRYRKIVSDIQSYLAVKSQTNFLTAVLVAASCYALNTPYALFIGLTAFFLNYIPTLGAIITAIPAVLLCLAVNTWQMALIMVVAQVFINLAIGSWLEPKLFGRKLGLSAAVVFLSLVFWGWILGPVGMFLSVPLTMLVKILLDNTDEFKWISILLGPGKP